MCERERGRVLLAPCLWASIGCMGPGAEGRAAAWRIRWDEPGLAGSESGLGRLGGVTQNFKFKLTRNGVTVTGTLRSSPRPGHGL